LSIITKLKNKMMNCLQQDVTGTLAITSPFKNSFLQINGQAKMNQTMRIENSFTRPNGSTGVFSPMNGSFKKTPINRRKMLKPSNLPPLHQNSPDPLRKTCK